MNTCDKKDDRKRHEMKLVEIGINRFPSFLSFFQLFLFSPLFHYISLFFLSHVFIKNLYHSMQKDFSHLSYSSVFYSSSILFLSVIIYNSSLTFYANIYTHQQCHLVFSNRPHSAGRDMLSFEKY